MPKVLMVCLGNICRSPLAEAVFENTVKNLGLQDEWEVDSAALGSWHVGKRPDYRALKTMQNHGLEYTNEARQIEEDDFTTFDFIFGMDHDNISGLEDRAPDDSTAKILLLGDFGLSPTEKIIRDPYYDQDAKGFEKCYQQCVVACKAFLDKARNGEV